MTYNFDPDAWLERQITALEARKTRGDIDRVSFEIELAELHRRYDEMLSRLDGTYEIPPQD